MSFVHLSVKSGYSFFNSTLRVDDLLGVKSDYLCLTDVNSMFLTLELFKKNHDKKIIIGMELNLNVNQDINHNVVVLAKGLEGYKSLCKLTKIVSNSLNKYSLTLDQLKKYSDNLIIILPISRNNNVFDFLDFYQNNFKTFYLGLEYYSINDLDLILKARSFNNFKRVLLTNDCAKGNDLETLKVLKCIEKGITLEDFNEELKVTSIDDESYLIHFSENEINETENIAKQCYFNVFDLKGRLYDIKIDDKVNYFKALCHKGLSKRGLYTEAYLKRLNYELDIIIKMNFTNYFLVVYDYVKFAKQNKILVGPGRGSAASSLVAYVLGITDVDPLKYDLLFERFLNPERVTMPDIDLDFVDERREEIITYLVNKYGYDHVSHVIAFQTFGARQALRDVGKVMGLSLIEVDLLSKKIPNIYKDNSLKEIYDNFYSFKAHIKGSDLNKRIFSIALKLEGLPRQTTLHAAGIIISEEKLYEVCPVYTSNNMLVSQYDKDYIEDIGLLKMDILALKNLTTIVDTLKLIDHEVILNESILNDKHIYDVIRSGLTSGVFQLESSGMKKAIKTLKPSNFNDVVALLALFRPGPMDNIPEYALLKDGKKKITLIDDSLKDILLPTYGIIIYQEQIMQILCKMASFSLGKADLVRRAISKKNEDILQSVKQEFIDGCLKNKYSLEKSEKVFNLILKFANYGFNKAHSVSYALISCEMAYLKYYYRVEFFTALLNNSLGNIQSLTKLDDYIDEINKMHIKILLPDINRSKYEFSKEGNNIRYSLSSISGINNLVSSNIINERKNGEFTSFLDFVLRMKKYNITDGNIMTLINAGCFDSLPFKGNDQVYNRESLRNSLGLINRYASIALTDNNQLLLDELVKKPEISEYRTNKLRDFNLEFQTLGVALTKSPLFSLKTKDFSNCANLKYGDNTVLIYVVSNHLIKTKKGNYMSISKVFDETGFIELVLFDEVLQKYNNLLVNGNYLIVKGYAKEKYSLVVNEIRKVDYDEESIIN